MGTLRTFFTNPDNLNFIFGLLVIVVAAVTFYFQSKSKAKQVILGLMLQTEKRAELYLLNNGQEMFNFVVARAYPLMPGVLRMIITYDAFKKLAQSLYDEAKSYLAKVIEQNPPSVVPPDLTSQEQVVDTSVASQVQEVSPPVVALPVTDSSAETTATQG